MFIFTLLSGLCLLFFPLQGIRDFKSEQWSYKITRMIFITLALLLITAGIIGIIDFVHNPRGTF